MAHAVDQPTAIVNVQLATIAQAIMHNEEQSRRAADRRQQSLRQGEGRDFG